MNGVIIVLQFFFSLLQSNILQLQKEKLNLRKILKTKNEKIISESGKTVENLLYGRVIKDLNVKEAIFILNSNNYKLSLKDFYRKFINLKKSSLEDIFNDAIKNKPIIDKSVIMAFGEYKKKKNPYYAKIIEKIFI